MRLAPFKMAPREKDCICGKITAYFLEKYAGFSLVVREKEGGHGKRTAPPVKSLLGDIAA